MTYDWYKVANKQDFEDDGFYQTEFRVSLEGLGIKDVIITRGNETSIYIDEVFLPVNFLGNNPFTTDNMAIYLDEATDDIYVGYEVEE